MNSTENKLQASARKAALNNQRASIIKKITGSEPIDEFLEMMRELDFINYKLDCLYIREELKKNNINGPKKDWYRASKQVSLLKTKR